MAGNILDCFTVRISVTIKNLLKGMKNTYNSAGLRHIRLINFPFSLQIKDTFPKAQADVDCP